MPLATTVSIVKSAEALSERVSDQHQHHCGAGNSEPIAEATLGGDVAFISLGPGKKYDYRNRESEQNWAELQKRPGYVVGKARRMR
jgi:hypothetical protein